MHVLGKFVKGLVVFGTKGCIRLPFGTICCDILACLGQLAELGDFWQGSYTQHSVFQLVGLVVLCNSS